MPLCLSSTVAAILNRPENAASAVKNQPRPIASRRGCIAATAAADNTQRVILPAAAAVLVFLGEMSTISVLCVWLVSARAV